jgi:hypothetical protein
MTCSASKAEEVEIRCAHVEGQKAGRCQIVDVVPYFQPKLSWKANKRLKRGTCRRIRHS